MKKPSDLLSDESGATAIEYGLVVTLISIAIVFTLMSVGKNLSTVFAAVGSILSASGDPGR